MITLPDIWKKLVYFLTGNNKYKSDGQEKAVEFINEYRNKDGINLNYIACNKISNYVATDSTITVSSLIAEAGTERSIYLDEQVNVVWGRIKQITARALGGGKYSIFPYYDGKRLQYDYVEQSRIRVLEYSGEQPIDVAILCETKKEKTTEYFRFRRYQLVNNSHIISELYSVNGNGFSQASPIKDWQPITPIVIENVDRLLFAYVDCPVDPRTDEKFYRVKLTDGADKIIEDIQGQFNYLATEYKLKESKIFVDEAALGVDDKGNRMLTKDNIFAMLSGGGSESLFEIFDPAIRFDPIYARLKFSFELLEKQIGVSQGIFSNPESLGTYTNQSNIKRAVYDTYSLVTDMRANIKLAMEDLAYSIDILAEAYNITPQGSTGDYSINIDWSNAMIEDMSEEWKQYTELADRGGLENAELRQWLKGESYQAAKDKVDLIAKQVPDVTNLLKGFTPSAEIE